MITYAFALQNLQICQQHLKEVINNLPELKL